MCENKITEADDFCNLFIFITFTRYIAFERSVNERLFVYIPRVDESQYKVNPTPTIDFLHVGNYSFLAASSFVKKVLICRTSREYVHSNIEIVDYVKSNI